MLNRNDILATQDMIDKRHLDIRTITMGISLLDCADADINKFNEKVYNKITTYAKDLVKVGDDLAKEYGIPVVNKRISVTPIAIAAESCETEDYTIFAQAMDKAARTMGLPYPGGLNMDRLSKDGDSTAFKFPKPKVENCPYDFSFSGLKTSVINTIHNASQKGTPVNEADLGASFMKAVATSLCENTEKAMLDYGYKKLVLAGGVSANSVLRSQITEVCRKHGWKLYFPELSLCGDNAAMVGAQGYYEYIRGNTASLELNAFAGMGIE